MVQPPLTQRRALGLPCSGSSSALHLWQELHPNSLTSTSASTSISMSLSISIEIRVYAKRIPAQLGTPPPRALQAGWWSRNGTARVPTCMEPYPEESVILRTRIPTCGCICICRDRYKYEHVYMFIHIHTYLQNRICTCKVSNEAYDLNHTVTFQVHMCIHLFRPHGSYLSNPGGGCLQLSA